MQFKNSVKWYVVLHIIFLIYAFSALLGKQAGTYSVGNMGFLLLYGGSLACMGIYALVWQQVIKHLPLISAYASKAVTVLWGLAFGALVYGERISARQMLAVCLIAAGIILLAFSDRNSAGNDE